MSGRILVFGGGGQLGRDLSRAAQSHCVPIAALDRAAADIADADAVNHCLKEFQPAVVINAAAHTRVDDAEAEPREAERSNVIGAAIVADACAAAKIPLIHISTDYVFDGSKAEPYNECDEVRPVNVYGSTKARGEQEVRARTDRHVIMRVSWLFGEFGSNFLKTMLRLANERQSIRVVDDQYGSPTSTRDAAAAILRVVSRLKENDQLYGTYHFSGAGTTSRHGFASLAVERSNALKERNTEVVAIKTSEFPAAAARPENSALDCSKFERAFGFRGRPWREEVSEIADSLLRNGFPYPSSK